MFNKLSSSNIASGKDSFSQGRQGPPGIHPPHYDISFCILIILSESFSSELPNGELLGLLNDVNDVCGGCRMGEESRGIGGGLGKGRENSFFEGKDLGEG